MSPPPTQLAEIARVFGRIGCLSFGGPAAQIALMHRELVEQRPWLSEDEFLRGLSFCMLLPGPEAMQLATYAGWRRAGVAGGVIAGGLFVLPGAVVIFALAYVYALWGDVPAVDAVFLGIQATVVVVVIQAILRLSARALTRTSDRVLAILAFVSLFAFALPFPLVIAVAAVWGALRATPDMPRPEPAPARSTPATSISATSGPATFTGESSSRLAVAVCAGLWALPVAILWASEATFLTELALFFSRMAVVTFGGAYAVLAYMTQEVVTAQGWISATEMIDALGLAETTPGPLILVTQFVGVLAGYHAGGPGLALLAGLVTLWVTFIPCFLWIFAGAPLIGRLTTLPRLSGALAAITAAVVGVIANLSLWFALHVFFGMLLTIPVGPASLLLPEWSTLRPLPLGLAAISGVALLLRGWPLPAVLAGSAALSLLASAIGG